MSTPRISLCMIARDEQENLGQCLASVRQHVDEVIVVDTGSVDETARVAQSFGARVVLFDRSTNPEAFYVDDEVTCRAFGAPPPFSGEVALGDFSAARAESFKYATGDFVFWIDADDVLEDAHVLRGIVGEMAQKHLDIGFLAYDYARDHAGRVFYRQWRERIIRRGVARWTNPVHEVLLPVGQTQNARFEGITVSHRRKADRKSIPNRNYKILLRQLYQQLGAKGVDAILQPDGNPDKRIDPRQLFYLGQEARFIDPPRAAQFYEAYLRGSGWGEERAAAHVALGHLLEFGMLPGINAAEGYARADREYATAAAEMPDNPDGLFGMARIAYLRGRHLDCINFTERGLKIGNTESMLGANPLDRLYRPHVYYNHSLSLVGRLEDAIASCKAGLAVCPDDPGVPGGAQGMLTNNLKAYEAELARRAGAPAPAGAPSKMLELDKFEDVDAPAAQVPHDALVIWALQLWKQIVGAGDLARARAFLETIPASITNDSVVQKMREATERRSRGSVATGLDLLPPAPPPPKAERAPDGKVSASVLVSDVVVWIGPSVEDWDPTTPEKQGIGGSETACIEVCRNLAALGHRVTVYGSCPQTEGVYEGVTYRHWQALRDEVVECDVFISSRAPAIMEAHQRIRARLKLLWVHDIHVGPPTPQLDRWLHRFDRVLCLSNWHKDYFLSVYPTLARDKVLVTRNGIDPARFPGAPFPVTLSEYLFEQKKARNMLVWSSSPNRGLDMLLHNFQFIRKEVPDAELHIFYGFECWESFARARGAEDELSQIRHFKKYIEDAVRRGGVHFHGRRPQSEVARAYMRAKVWPYLTNFTETSCITAMEAQAAGAVPVCSSLAALPETVKHGVFVKNDSPNVGQIFVEEVVDLLRNDQRREALARAGREWAMKNLSWAALAREWAEMFEKLFVEVDDQPIAKWRSA